MDYSKKGNPYTWAWKTLMDDEGAIDVLLSETFHPADDTKARGYSTTILVSHFSLEKMIELIEKYGAKDSKFEQVTKEGALAAEVNKAMKEFHRYCMDQLENGVETDGVIGLLPNGSINISFERRIKEVAVFKAVLHAFKSSISYDSPYGGGFESKYSIPYFLGIR